MIVSQIQNVFYFLFLLGYVYSQTNVAILSEKVGTEIDIHENRFYRIFPDEKGFVNAQIIDAGNGNFRITIVKQIQGMETTVRRYIDQDDFQKYKIELINFQILQKKEKLKCMREWIL